MNWDSLYGELENMGWRWGSSPTFGGILSDLLVFVFPFAGLLVLLFLIYGGFMYMTSAGDPKKAQTAQGIITTALAGFLVIFVSYWIVQIIAVALGIPDIQNIFGNDLPQ